MRLHTLEGNANYTLIQWVFHNKNSFDKERPNKPDKRNRICLCVSEILLTRVINILQLQKEILRCFLKKNHIISSLLNLNVDIPHSSILYKLSTDTVLSSIIIPPPQLSAYNSIKIVGVSGFLNSLSHVNVEPSPARQNKMKKRI